MIGAVAIGACALLIATSVFYVPVLVSRKIHREKKARKEHKERMRYLEERKEYLEQIRQAGKKQNNSLMLYFLALLRWTQ